MRISVIRLLTIGILFLGTTSILCAQEPDSSVQQEGELTFDSLDPFDYFGSSEIFTTDDKNKSAEELVREGLTLLRSERLLDARTKLLKALQKDPENIEAYSYLAGYYMVHVGHFRLAMKHIKRAEELFLKKNGAPPYSKQALKEQHAMILYHISQNRLNLDNYQGALDTLDEFTRLGYYAEWYPGSRAWILMKLGKIQEAIKVARLGILGGAEPARTLNMLGILLSMNDQRKEAIEVFRKAISYEMSQGSEGQPATPLNNVGEVYREMFEDDQAERSFIRATGMSDGCEHVLPTLNAVLLYIEQLRLSDAAEMINAFNRCMARFPLKNGEEHQTLVHLARGRIDLHSGKIERAIEHFEASLFGTQWFGKIGTNQDDLLAAASISLAQALEQKNHLLSYHLSATWQESYSNLKERAQNKARAWWLMRRARQIIVNDLKDVEDLTIRNTDSLIEYPTFGTVLSELSRASLLRKLQNQRSIDPRIPAQTFYTLYQAESSLDWWHRSEGGDLLKKVLRDARPKYDALVTLQAQVRLSEMLSQTNPDYYNRAYAIFAANPAAIRNHGLRLPVRVETSSDSNKLTSLLWSSSFIESANKESCLIKFLSENSSDNQVKYKATFSCPSLIANNGRGATRSVDDLDPVILINKLSDSVFTEEIDNGSDT